MARPDTASRQNGDRRAVGRLDRVAIGLSTLCVVHCVATVVLAATLATAGAALADPAWHEAGFALAMAVGAVALGRGYALHRDLRPLAIGGGGLALMGLGLTLHHGALEIALTVAGVILLARAHALNMHRHATPQLVGDPPLP